MEQNRNITIIHPSTLIYFQSEFNRRFKLLQPGTRKEIADVLSVPNELSYDDIFKMLEEAKEKEIVEAGEMYDYTLRQGATYKVVWYVGGRIKETLARGISEKLAYSVRARARGRYRVGTLMVEVCN